VIPNHYIILAISFDTLRLPNKDRAVQNLAFLPIVQNFFDYFDKESNNQYTFYQPDFNL